MYFIIWHVYNPGGGGRGNGWACMSHQEECVKVVSFPQLLWILFLHHGP